MKIKKLQLQNFQGFETIYNEQKSPSIFNGPSGFKKTNVLQN